MAEGPPRPKSPRQELFRGQLKVQYTAFANNGFGITLQGIPRFLRYLPPTDHGAHTSLNFRSVSKSRVASFCVPLQLVSRDRTTRMVD